MNDFIISSNDYTLVDYIQSTGTQYIDTGIKSKGSLKVITDIEYTSTISGNHFVFGARDGARNKTNGLLISDNGTKFRNDYNTTVSNASPNISGVNKKWHIEKDKGKFTATSSSQTITQRTTNSTFTSSYNVYIFAMNNAGAILNASSYRLYGFKIYDDNTLVRDFIPCYRNSDDEVGLYDLVNNVFYTNAGTGKFTYGKKINMLDSDKQALLNGSATIPFKINIIQDSEIVKTLDEHSIVNLDYEDFRYVDTESLGIGQFVAIKAVGTLDQIYTEFEIEDTELELQMGVSYNGTTHYYSLGNFLVTKPSTDDVKDKTSFEAMDYTKKFNIPFTDTGLTFPCTALQLAQYTCNLCGVELATTDFANYDFEIPNNQYTEGDTCRKVMQDIGKLAYSWVRIGWDNKCYIDFEIKNTVEDYNTITNSQYYDLSLQKKAFGPVNRVVIGIRDVEGENAVIEDSASIEENGVTEIQLYDSNITYTPELRLQAINAASRLFGLTYTPMELNTIGHPWLEGNDKIEVVDMNGDSLYTYPWDRTIAYNGHIKSKLTSKADTKTETEYRNYGNLETATRQTRIIVDKQNQVIEALAEQVKPISNEISGAGSITLENAYVGTLHRLEIIGEISSLLPKNTLLPSNTLRPFEITLDVDGTKYVLGINYLHYTNSQNHDTYVYEDGRQWIERADGTIEDFGEISIEVDKNSTLSVTNFNDVQLKATYLLENEWTDTFSPTIDLVSKINLTPGKAGISANKIKLEGYTTINENFGVDLQGNMWARNGSFSGNIYLEDGNRILGGDGLYSCLAFTNTGRYSNWDILGYWASGLNVAAGPASYSDVFVTAYIPNNFVVDSAYLVMQTSSMYSAYSDMYGDYSVTGYPKQLKLFKGDDGTTVSFFYYPYQAVDEYTEYSGTEIPNAFGEASYTPSIVSPGDIVEKTTIDISDYISEGMNTLFVRSTITPRPQIKTYTPSGSSYSAFDYGEVVLNTGIAKLNLYVFGYMSVSEEE